MGEGAKRTRVMLRTLKDSVLAPNRGEAALTGRLRFQSHVAKLCHENGFQSRRKTILAPGPALGSTGRLTRYPEVGLFGINLTGNAQTAEFETGGRAKSPVVGSKR